MQGGRKDWGEDGQTGGKGEEGGGGEDDNQGLSVEVNDAGYATASAECSLSTSLDLIQTELQSLRPVSHPKRCIPSGGCPSMGATGKPPWQAPTSRPSLRSRILCGDWCCGQVAAFCELAHKFSERAPDIRRGAHKLKMLPIHFLWSSSVKMLKRSSRKSLLKEPFHGEPHE